MKSSADPLLPAALIAVSIKALFSSGLSLTSFATSPDSSSSPDTFKISFIKALFVASSPNLAIEDEYISSTSRGDNLAKNGTSDIASLAPPLMAAFSIPYFGVMERARLAAADLAAPVIAPLMVAEPGTIGINMSRIRPAPPPMY